MQRSLLTVLFAGLFALFATYSYGEEPSCQGADLFEMLTQAQRNEIEKKASGIINGNGRFWKIEKEGVAPSWLMGTMHVGDPRVTTLSPSEKDAFDKSQRVALELSEVVDTNNVIFKMILDNPARFTYPDNDMLKKQLSAEQFAELEQALKKRGLSYYVVSRMKPWIVWITLSIPPCAIEDEKQGHLALDVKLGKDAVAQGKELIGLETPDEQFSAIDAIPMQFHIDSITSYAELGDKLNDYYSTMINLYLAGKISAIAPFLETAQAQFSDADMAMVDRVMLEERNVRMAERAKPLLEKGDSFIAVGAFHLIGETGLVEQFRRQGYRVTKVD